MKKKTVKQLEARSRLLYKAIMENNLDRDEKFLVMNEWADVENELDRLARLGGINDL